MTWSRNVKESFHKLHNKIEINGYDDNLYLNIFYIGIKSKSQCIKPNENKNNKKSMWAEDAANWKIHEEMGTKWLAKF